YLDGIIPAGGHYVFAVGPVRHSADLGGVSAALEQLGMTEPFEISPFPVTQLRRAFVEHLLRLSDVVVPPLPLRQGHAIDVEKRFGPLQLLLGQQVFRFGTAALFFCFLLGRLRVLFLGLRLRLGGQRTVTILRGGGFGTRCPHRLPGRRCCPQNECPCHQRRGYKRHLIPPRQLAEAIPRRPRP